PAFDGAGFVQALTKCSKPLRERPRRHPAEKPDHRHHPLLAARHNRPRRRAAKPRDECAPLHSITSSARRSSASGTVRANALAVLRLITNSYLVGCCMGRSLGFVPRRILLTRSAARANWSTRLAP